MYMAQGMAELACKQLVAALQLDPDNAPAREKLKWMRRVLAETTRVKDEIEKAIRLYRLYPTDHPYCAQAIDQLDAVLRVEPGAEVYCGMIGGEHRRPEELRASGGATRARRAPERRWQCRASRRLDACA